MFCDQAPIMVIAGKGGDGMTHFRREKFVAYGGPDGGDGGNGGSIIFQVDENLNTLADFKSHKIFRAEDGGNGHTDNSHGKSASDLILLVPPGTQMYDDETDKLIIDLVEENLSYVIVKGGRGGYGNAHFASSTRQTPNFSEMGEPGAERHIRLELKLVADVGIIGLPSVGKSTLISRISHAKPKIADYPFTTLIPNLGIVDLGEFDPKERGKTFVVADMPGLIEGAHKGKGLGDQFLRHIARTFLLVHVLDANSQDIVKDYETVCRELALYDKKLAKEKQIVVINKIDLLDKELADMVRDELLAAHPELKRRVYLLSAVQGSGLKIFIFALWEALQKALLSLKKRKKVSQVQETEHKIFRPHLDDPHAFQVRLVKFRRGQKVRVYEVTGKRIEQIVVMTDIDNEEGLARVYDILGKSRINAELAKAGAKVGDVIRIQSKEIPYIGR